MDIVALLEVLVKGIFAAEEKFLKNPKDFYGLETVVKASTESFSLSAIYTFTIVVSFQWNLTRYTCKTKCNFWGSRNKYKTKIYFDCFKMEINFSLHLNKIVTNKLTPYATPHII